MFIHYYTQLTCKLQDEYKMFVLFKYIKATVGSTHKIPRLMSCVQLRCLHIQSETLGFILEFIVSFMNTIHPVSNIMLSEDIFGHNRFRS